ncbi:cell division protein ZapA [Suttonella ornithocola]|uniref:Cell division protein ZapA n=1 Tax=Suttonella ornithocola TaxID=279832 RepID=A0A380MN28_9GAMM|nr:cell division protein ZapA [Suttonella ornithocola]SUO93303.1 Z ring-associated protein ZapA [Suttonella ornithocola]
MSKQKMKITLQILENSYPLMCEPHERNLLIEAADKLNTHLQELRRENPRLPLERLLIMGGLQMTFDLLQEQQIFAKEVALVNEISGRLVSSLDMALSEEALSNGENV